MNGTINIIDGPSTTPTPSVTSTATVTPTPSVSSSGATPTPTASVTSTPTPSVSSSTTGATPTPTASVTSTATVTPTPSTSNTPLVSQTPTPTLSVTSTNTQTPTPTPSISVTNTPDVSQTPTPTVTVTATPSTSITPTNSITPTTTVTPSVSLAGGPTPTLTPSISQTVTPSVTATPTQTATPTPTPSPSLQTGNTLNMGLEYESGSTIANYTLTASTAVNQDTDVRFKNTIFETDGTQHLISTAITLNVGATTATTQVRLDSLNYSDVNAYETVVSGVTYSGVQFGSVDTVSKVSFTDKPEPIWGAYTFRGCCPKDGTVVGWVTSDAIAVGGWVANGGGIIHQGKCYRPQAVGGSNPVQYFYGAEIKSCSDTKCPTCPTPSASVTPSITPSISVTPSYCHDGLDGYVECCTLDMYDCGITSSPTPTPSNTPSISVTPTNSVTPSVTPSISVTPTNSVTPSVTASVTATPSLTPSNTATPSLTPSNTATPTLTPSVTVTPSVSPVAATLRTCCEENSHVYYIHPSVATVNNVFENAGVCYKVIALGGSPTGTIGFTTNYGVNQCDACQSCIGDTACSGNVSGKAEPCSGVGADIDWTSTLAQSPCIGDSFTHNSICYEITTISSGAGSGVSITLDGCC